MNLSQYFKYNTNIVIFLIQLFYRRRITKQYLLAHIVDVLMDEIEAMNFEQSLLDKEHSIIPNNNSQASTEFQDPKSVANSSEVLDARKANKAFDRDRLFRRIMFAVHRHEMNAKANSGEMKNKEEKNVESLEQEHEQLRTENIHYSDKVDETSSTNSDRYHDQRYVEYVPQNEGKQEEEHLFDQELRHSIARVLHHEVRIYLRQVFDCYLKK